MPVNKKFFLSQGSRGGVDGVSGLSASDEPQRGVVTVIDIVRVNAGGSGREEVNIGERAMDGVVAHFIAHNRVSCPIKLL